MVGQIMNGWNMGRSSVSYLLEIVYRLAHMAFVVYGIYLMWTGELSWFIYGFILLTWVNAKYDIEDLERKFDNG